MSKRVVISPLEWGLGHATRLVPIIKLLIKYKADILIIASGKSYTFLKSEFPSIKIIKIRNFKIHYPKNKIGILNMILWIPKIFAGIIYEHFTVKKIAKIFNANIIISDNRYGLLFRKYFCVLITHQIFIKLPNSLLFFEKIIHKIFLFYLNKFDKVWIPDNQKPNSFTGNLTDLHILTNKFEFIGALSRIDFTIDENVNGYNYYSIVILSGQEKQRTVLENIILNQIENTDKKFLLVRGILNPENKLSSKNKNITIVNFLNSADLVAAIELSENIICRAGYSTIMDLLKLKRKAILIPTPGQTEQEYLAEYLKSKKWFYSCNQYNFNIYKAIDNLHEFNLPKTDDNGKTLEKKISNLLGSKLLKQIDQ